MSINGLQQQYFANSLDGLTYLDVNGISINGDNIDLTALVPYTGADKPVDVGVQPIRTSYIPTINTDVVNLLALNQTTTGTVGYVDQYYVPYNNAISDTNLGNKAFTVGVAGNTSLSNLVRTELNNVLAGYNPASIVVGNNFGTITNAGGVYESTSTATFASLFLGTITAGEKYSVSISVKCIDPNYTTQIYIYEASAPNYLSGGIQLLSFAIPPNTTGFNVFTGTINPTLTNLLLVFSTQIVSGINTLYWNAFSLTGMGSVVKNLIAPSTGLDGANKTYVDTADALRVPYTGATGDVDLGIYKISSSTAPSTGNNLSNKTYVDAQDALRASLTGNNTLSGINSFTNTVSMTPATATATFSLGLNGSNQIVKFTPSSAVFTGSVGVSYIPYATSANVFANSLLYQSSGSQINCADSFYATNTITAGGDMNCVIINPSGGYGRLDDRSLRPKDINAGTEQFFFASWNNDGGGPYADAIGMNGWTDSSGGGTNVLMVRKDTFGIRQYQGTFGSTTPYVNSPAISAQYMDVCMKGVGDNTKTIFQPIGGTWNVPLTVGSGTDSGGAQLICTNGNVHCDPAPGTELYFGYYGRNATIQNYATTSINNRTRYQYHYTGVDGDAHAYFQNANSGSSAYFNIILNCNDNNVNHFLNSVNRSTDGGSNCYTIRNDTNGGIRFSGVNGGFSSYGVNSPSSPYVNAITNYVGSPITGGAGWNNSGYTLFCATTIPANGTPALGLGVNGATYTAISSIRPGINWMDLYISAAQTQIYFNGALSAYTAGGGWVQVSDAREKADINDLKTSRSLERIMKCKPKWYKRKYYDTDKDGKDTTPAPQSIKDTICIGLLAQDVLQTNPHCVSGWKNDNIKETDDDDGSRYGINYGDFTVHLIGAVQEQQKQIETLTERSKVMEQHARSLEDQLAQSRRDLEEYKNLTEERFNKLAKMISGK